MSPFSTQRPGLSLSSVGKPFSWLPRVLLDGSKVKAPSEAPNGCDCTKQEGQKNMVSLPLSTSVDKCARKWSLPLLPPCSSAAVPHRLALCLLLPFALRKNFSFVAKADFALRWHHQARPAHRSMEGLNSPCQQGHFASGACDILQTLCSWRCVSFPWLFPGFAGGFWHEDNSIQWEYWGLTSMLCTAPALQAFKGLPEALCPGW